MSRLRLVAVLGVLILLAACGGRPAAGPPGRHLPRPVARGSQARPSRLAWKVGQVFSGAVAFDELDQGSIDDELQFTARERFQVVRVDAGGATIRVAVTSWHWQRNTSELLTNSLPRPFTFEADGGAKIVSGVDWPLPADLPLPGLDIFATPLTAATGWSRTDGEGAALSYQVAGASASGTSDLGWSVVRPQFTMSGEPVTVSGHAEATISSGYQRHGSRVTLRSTREQATFQRTTESAAGATQETGTILETTIFTWP